jgi:hypothetical protein
MRTGTVPVSLHLTLPLIHSKDSHVRSMTDDYDTYLQMQNNINICNRNLNEVMRRKGLIEKRNTTTSDDVVTQS